MNKTTLVQKVTPVGLLVAFGIIYGDIGTSPLYTMSAIIGTATINQRLVYGGISCVFWTLTLQTTFKYVILTLRADNNGEGGIFSLFAKLKRNYKTLTIVAILGGSALLADGIITPPISVSSAIEGLQILYPDLKTVPIVIIILNILFISQTLGTNTIGKSFGPVMLIWFSMLGVFGLMGIIANPRVLMAISPYYAYDLLAGYPHGFWLLGAVFLCTTGAEALYSDMGHCGRANVRVSWIFVKTTLVLNYFGQAAWIMGLEGKKLTMNAFYGLMPGWFLIPGIIISTLATIIASQALITGSYTLISEAIRLNLWPKVRIVYPSDIKGQLYVPSINLLLWIGCVGIVLYFGKSAHMEAAYGLSITITMLMTTILLAFYLHLKKIRILFIAVFLLFYLSIECSFLAANLLKFMHGGYVSVIITLILVFVMTVWAEANRIKNRLTEFVRLDAYIPKLRSLSNDTSIPKYATHLIYMTSAVGSHEIESKIIYSILEQRPKRADLYWFVHVNITEEPYTCSYKVDILAPEDVIRITFRLGFRMEQLIGLYLKKVIKEMAENNEVDISSRYQSLNKEQVVGDFTFVVLKKFLSYENNLPVYEKVILGFHFFIKHMVHKEASWFGIDANHLVEENMPLVIRPARDIELKREC